MGWLAPLLALLTASVVAFVILAPHKAWGYSGGDRVELTLVSIGQGFYLRADAATAFDAMRRAASAEGVALVVVSAFRTWEEQTRLYSGYVSKAPGFNQAAVPGFSNHQGGIAVDVDTDRGTSAAYDWLSKNAGRFGFRRTVASEPWHWEFKR
jgi:LAS superfamily LD-carboxypeptidase LdcB